MLAPDDSSIPASVQELLALLENHGMRQWAEGKFSHPSREALIHLCKFGYFTGLLSKAQIASYLKLDRPDLKNLLKAWYDDHRSKGCGTC